jgi:hypothetical protein
MEMRETSSHRCKRPSILESGIQERLLLRRSRKDNYSTHKSATVKRWFKSRKHRHFYFHFTPNSSSVIYLALELDRS